MSLRESIARGRALALWLLLGLLACVSNRALAAEEAAKLDRPPDAYGFGRSLAISGENIVVGAPDTGGSIFSAPGAAFVFTRIGTGWVEQAMLRAPDDDFYFELGTSVDIDGDVIVAGAPSCGEPIQCGPGAVYVFRRQHGTWTREATLTAPVPAVGDAFGYSVSISGDVVVVGGFDVVHVFRWNGTTWDPEAVLTGSDTELGDGFGLSVSVAGDLLVAGAIWDDELAGSAYVFKWDGSAWVQEAKLIPRDTPIPDRFGKAVAISKDWVAVGAVVHRQAAAPFGIAYMFHREGTSWIQRAALGGLYNQDEFGSALDISDDVTVVGAPGYDSDQGVAFLFRREGTTWIEVDELTPSDADGSRYRFGGSICVDGGTGVVSGGGVYVYEFLGLPADLRSYAGFANCFDGYAGVLRDGCQSFDIHPDGHVGLFDYRYLFARFTGP